MFFLARSRTAQYVVRYLINCTKRSMGRFPNEKTGKRGNFSHMVGPLPTVRAQREGIFNFRVYRVRVLLKTSGSGRVSGIFAKKIINRVFSGIENLDRVFSGTS